MHFNIITYYKKEDTKMKAYLGIDIAKSKFDVALLQNNKYKFKIFENNIKGFEALYIWLGENVKAIHFCLEATGTYGEALSYYLADKDLIVSVVNPAQIKGFAQSELSRNKTDKADSKLIARYCRAMTPSIWKPLPSHVRFLQCCVRRLKDLQSIYQEESNRLEIAQEFIQVDIQETIDLLGKKIKDMRKKIQNHIEQHTDLKEKNNLLKTIPGIGETTIAQILSFMGTPERFKNVKQLIAFVGLNPRQYQSGSSFYGKTRLSKTGDSELRKSLYMPAIVAKQHNPIVKAFCQRLQKSGKPPMVIVCAAMRKLLHIIFGVLKSGKSFNASLAIV